MQETIFEKIGVKYELRGDCYYPVFAIEDSHSIEELGRYGRDWLKMFFEVDRMMYNRYLLQGTLITRAYEFEQYANETEYRLVYSNTKLQKTSGDFLADVAAKQQKLDEIRETLMCDALTEMEYNKEARVADLRRKS